MTPWLFLESYYDGSHRHLVDGLIRRLDRPCRLYTLPARKWKWRMRGASMAFAARLAEENPDLAGIVCTSLANAAELRGLLPARYRALPLVVYFHENQLAYPVQAFDPRDYHFAWTNLASALVADVVLWNSRFNRDSFLSGMRDVIKKMPDARPAGALDAIAARSRIFPVPLDVAAHRARSQVRDGVCRIVWNHRWEFDKGPRLLLECVEQLNGSGADYRISILGQTFETVPPEFQRVKEAAGDRLDVWGRLERRDAYLDHLGRQDVALSTADHEFQGLAVLEAAAGGAIPLVPDDLAYREIWPTAYRVDRTELPAALVDRARRVDHWRAEAPSGACDDFDWAVQVPRWERLLAELA